MVSFVKSPQFRAITSRFGENVIKPWLINKCQYYNPSLTGDQLDSLRDTLSRIFKAYEEGRPISPMVKSLIALAVPHGEYAYELFETFVNFSGSNSIGPTVQGSSDSSITPYNDGSVDKKADALLVNGYVCDWKLIGEVPPSVRTKIANGLQSRPVCGITLEDILDSKTNKIIPNVVILVTNGRSGLSVHFFRKDALDRWFREGRHTNPMNQQFITMNRDYFRIS